MLTLKHMLHFSPLANGDPSKHRQCMLERGFGLVTTQNVFHTKFGVEYVVFFLDLYLLILQENEKLKIEFILHFCDLLYISCIPAFSCTIWIWGLKCCPTYQQYQKLRTSLIPIISPKNNNTNWDWLTSRNNKFFKSSTHFLFRRQNSNCIGTQCTYWIFLLEKACAAITSDICDFPQPCFTIVFWVVWWVATETNVFDKVCFVSKQPFQRLLLWLQYLSNKTF